MMGFFAAASPSFSFFSHEGHWIVLLIFIPYESLLDTPRLSWQLRSSEAILQAKKSDAPQAVFLTLRFDFD